VSYGYQSNPLFNSEQIGDQVRSTYLEIGHLTDGLSTRYVGGLTLFNRLRDRDYLEHGLHGVYNFSHGGLEAILEGEGGEADEGLDSPPDSSAMYGTLFARIGARHDRAAFRDYDNAAAWLGSSLRWGFENWFIRVGVEGGYRVYPYTRELSNVSGLLSAEGTFTVAGGVSLGLRCFGGMKHFTVAAFDTGRFEPARTYVTVVKQGAGKGGAKITVKESSGKAVLANGDLRTATQIGGSAFVRADWGTGSAGGEVLYRENPAGSARVLVRTPETATINEDIYADFFSYEGPGVRLILRQRLPGAIAAMVTLEHQRKLFGAPAFDIAGNEISGTRVDRRTGCEFYVSRWTSLSSAVGLDVALSGSLLKNESNDIYNDFTGWSINLSLGVGI
jgi:hypothetical protein